MRKLTGWVLLVSLAPVGAQAQVLYGSIVGNVTDASEGRIPQATISITNT